MFSQQWNPAKYAFATDKQGVSISYTSLIQLIKHLFRTLTYYNKISERSAFSICFDEVA
jgi:hypothetical protein